MLRLCFEVTTGIIAPESLSGSVVIQRATTAAEFKRLEATIAQVQTGDIVLTRTPGRFYGFFRNMVS